MRGEGMNVDIEIRFEGEPEEINKIIQPLVSVNNQKLDCDAVAENAIKLMRSRYSATHDTV